jgi:hypothetical protein
VYPTTDESTVTRAAYDAALQQAERASRLAARVEALETVNAALLQALLRLPGGAEAVAEIVARVAGL